MLQSLAQRGLKRHLQHLPSVSTKHKHIVTHLDMDQALYLWVKHMETEGEVVTGNMLCAKQRFFEEELEVPEESWL